MPFGLPWSESFICDMADKEFRDEFVADQIRTRIAMLIRALREQPDRDWSQTRLGQEMGKPQSVISRIEDPDYGKLSLQTLLEVAAAFELPLWIDIPEWEEWLRLIKDVPNSKTARKSFDSEYLAGKANKSEEEINYGKIARIRYKSDSDIERQETIHEEGVKGLLVAS
jgi:transcriptional regulator with XRE-family HTH domain